MKGLTFDEESHTYTYNGVVLTSVTTFISQFFNPFDAKRIAKFKAMLAKKNNTKGKTSQYWLRQWKLAADHGTIVHNAIESRLTYSPNPVTYNEPRDHFKTEEAINYLIERGYDEYNTKIICEKQVVAPSLGLAGTVDLILKTPTGIHIIDWKTNDKIPKTGFKGQKCKDPISHLPDCSYSKYSLQLQLYAFILQELYNEKILSLTLVHLKEDRYEPLSIPIEFDDVTSILNHTL